ncbi:MAG: respiratory nitrate reductase subunit gamma [Acidobacteria bacterium]|nr:MAG: respiratory nitrate reductase subunit gamma [Acidobacteriota bacterium]
MISQYLEPILFGVLPYAVFLNFFVFTIHRYRSETFTYSSLSSQFLENRKHFWGLAPFHFGIVAILTGHLVAFLIPGEILLWNSRPLRLYALEITGLSFALLATLGLLGAVRRRLIDSKVSSVTTGVDWLVDILLLFQLVSGIYIAVFHAWGSSWFAASLAPYLWSLLKFNPNISFLATMPLVVKFHIINFYLLIGVFPFTRLVHILVAPNPYFWRKPQLVRWYRKVAPLAGE